MPTIHKATTLLGGLSSRLTADAKTGSICRLFMDKQHLLFTDDQLDNTRPEKLRPDRHSDFEGMPLHQWVGPPTPIYGDDPFLATDDLLPAVPA